MPKYAYQAINDAGQTISGTVEADSRDAASNLVLARGLIPSRVVQEAGAGWFTRLDRALTPVRAWDLILFSKQLGTMLRAGIPIVKVFQILESQTDNKKLKGIIAEMLQDIQGGASLHEAFNRHPEAFSEMYSSMIHAGETGGSLPEVLDRLIYVIEHEYKIKKDIRSALTYPIVVISALAAAFFVLLTFVVPKFIQIFERAHIAIPLPTRICMIMYTALADYWFIILGVLGAVTAVLYTYLRTERGKYTRDVIFINIPMIGPLFVKAAMSRFASIFAILNESGVNILEIVAVLSGTIGNTAISRVFGVVGERLREGKGFAEPLSNAPYFPPMVVNMVAIGEESGNLSEMLSEVSRHYDSEVEYATARLSSALGPVLTLGLAVVVGFFALAIYLPMWDLTKMVH